jgi:hypothetical protein
MLVGYGRSKSETDAELYELSAVTIGGTSQQLLAVADFIRRCAVAMANDPAWDHEHLQDAWTQWKQGDLDLIVAKVSEGRTPFAGNYEDWGSAPTNPVGD